MKPTFFISVWDTEVADQILVPQNCSKQPCYCPEVTVCSITVVGLLKQSRLVIGSWSHITSWANSFLDQEAGRPVDFEVTLISGTIENEPRMAATLKFRFRLNPNSSVNLQSQPSVFGPSSQALSTRFELVRSSAVSLEWKKFEGNKWWWNVAVMECNHTPLVRSTRLVSAADRWPRLTNILR